MRYETADPDLAQRLIVSEAYAMQRKVDGQRLTVVKDSRGIQGFNKRGELCPVPPWLFEEMSCLPQEPWEFDGELCDSSYHIFDLMEAPKASVSEMPFKERMDVLSVIIDTWDTGRIQVIETHLDPRDKLKAFMGYGLAGDEGVVFRPHRTKAHYKGQVYKYKFVNTVDAVVMGHTEGKASIEVGVYRDNELVSLGKVSFEGVITEGEVVEVRYRTLSEGERLIEPVFMRIRQDKRPYACSWSQLTEGKLEQDATLLDKQATKVQQALGLPVESLHTIISQI